MSPRRDRASPEPPLPAAAATLPRSFILLTAFVAGMAVMVLELMGSRVIGPFYGVSLYVWASLIATALVALSFGYWIGGRLADRRATAGYLYGGILIGAALVCLLPVLRTPILRLTSPLGVRGGSLLSAIMLFLPPIACLGIVAPFAVKLHARSLASVGGSAGSLSAVSTVGSVVGTLLTGFVLIPSLPMDTIILGCGALLACLSLAFWIIRPRGRGVVASITVVVGAAALSGMDSLAPTQLRRLGVQIVHAAETPYGQLKVMDAGGVRYLLVNGSFQGEASLTTGRPTAPYIHVLAAACREYAPDARRVLCVGLGPGTLPGLVQRTGATVDAVDIDQSVIDAAGKYFGYQPGAGRTLAEDGRRYCATTTTTYDALLLDAFASEAIPEHLLTTEAFESYRRLLGSKGILGINLVGFAEGTARRVPQAVARTAATVFPHTAAWFIPQEGAEGSFGSFIIVASEAPLPDRDLGNAARSTAGHEPWIETVRMLAWPETEGGTVLTDQFNPIAAWNAPVDLAIRRQVLQFIPWEVLTG